ncbi:MAG: carbonic anhydrase [Acidimicrobiales bacterium]
MITTMNLTDEGVGDGTRPATDRVDPGALWADMVARHDVVTARDLPVGTPAHVPEVALLACSDARVPPSVLFDAAAGSLFVVRHAGNTASPAAVASLDYAVERLGVQLVVVLGHTSCGAVEAALAGSRDPDLVEVVDPIAAVIAACGHCDTVDEAVSANVAATVAALADHDGAVGRGARSGAVVIRGVVHDLATGELRPVATRPDPENPGTHDTTETP